MKYGELSKDITNEIVAKRIELENRKEKYYDAIQQLAELRKKCKHKNAVIKHGWQGGGIYYCYCTCPDCGRSGSRYIPQYHMHMNNEWYKTWGNTENLITLEKAIEIGKKIGNNFFDCNYWWGEVEDYDKLNKDTSKGWV